MFHEKPIADLPRQPRQRDGDQLAGQLERAARRQLTLDRATLAAEDNDRRRVGQVCDCHPVDQPRIVGSMRSTAASAAPAEPKSARTGPKPVAPATLGSSLAASVRLIGSCRGCGHQAEPDLAELVARYGAGLTLPAWGKRLCCSHCRSRETEFVVSGTRRDDRNPGLGG